MSDTAGKPNLDVSLSDRISSTRTERKPRDQGRSERNGGGGGGGGRGGSYGGTRRARPDRRERRPAPYSGGRQQGGSEGKVLLENLDNALTEEDIEDIFQDLGRCSVMVYYDRGGRSTGKAEVTFSRGSDAYQAVKEYDEAEVNGQSMRVKLVGGGERRGIEVRKAAPERTARAKACFVCGGEGHIAKDCPSGGDKMKDDACYNCGKEGHQRRNCPELEGKEGAAPVKGACFTCGKTGHRKANCPEGGAKGNGEGRAKGKGRKGREEKKPATQEDLDADMDDYFKQKDAAPAAVEEAAPAAE